MQKHTDTDPLGVSYCCRKQRFWLSSFIEVLLQVWLQAEAT